MCKSIFVLTVPLDTIPGRQCMASCFFLLRQFEDVLIYLNSIKVNALKPYRTSPATALLPSGVTDASPVAPPLELLLQ